MGIAGRFAVYYSWMTYLPSLIVAIYIIEKTDFKWINTIYLLISICIFAYGLPYSLYTYNKNENLNVDKFVHRQKFDDKTIIATSFISYFHIRNITNKCYFIEIYPEKLVPNNVEYMLTDESSEEKKAFKEFRHKRISVGRSFTAIDSISNPKMILYKIN